MADQQKVHPVYTDLEAPQAKAPLMAQVSVRSEKGNPDEQEPQHPHLPQSTIPYSYAKPPKQRNICMRCLCWTFCFLLLLILIIGILAGIIYFVFQPKIPKYTINGLGITQFSFDDAMNLHTTFDVNITATNPNKKIGIYYESGSHLSVWYTSTKLCEGQLPKFYQGHRNTTLLDVKLTGETDHASEMLSSLQAQQQQTGNIPLDLRAKVPVRIKLGKLKLMKWNFIVNCRLLVDRLSEANNIRIRKDNCNFRFRI